MAKNIIFILDPLITTIRETGSVERVSNLSPSLSLFFFFFHHTWCVDMQIYDSFDFILF